MTRNRSDVFNESLPVFESKPDLKVWEWAEQNVQFRPRSSPRPGLYRTEWCPYVRAPQEDWTNPEIESIVLCWASRTSKTETALNCIRYDIACAPEPILIVQPNSDDAGKFNVDRIRPSIEDSPALMAEMPKDSDDYTKDMMRFRRCNVRCVGANSPAKLKQFGVTKLLADEIDTWREQGRKETGALQLALDRTKDRWNRKHILTSTPTIEVGQIWIEFKNGDQRYFFVPCPHCGHMQTLKMDGIWFDDPRAKNEDGTWNIDVVREIACYECEKCKGHIEDIHKPMMLKKGEWRPTAKGKDPRRRSYHLNSIYPEWISFSDIAVKFLEAKGSSEALQLFVNAWLAEPFYAYGESAEQEKALMKNLASEPTDKVPKDAIALMWCDIQQDSIWYVIRAFYANRDSVLLSYGNLPGLDEAAILAAKFGLFCAGMDRKFRQQQVLEWAAQHPGWIPTMGAAGMFTSLKWVKVPIDGGLLKGREVRCLNFRPDDWKDELHNRINPPKNLDAPKPPTWKISPIVGDDYKKQMVGEVRAEKRGSRGRTIVEWIKRGPNHLFDCEVALLALFDSIKVFAFEAGGTSPMTLPPPMSSNPNIERQSQDQERDNFERSNKDRHRRDDDDLFQGEHTLPT